MTKKTALIFGASGQDGSYLSQLLLSKEYKVIGTSRAPLPKKNNNLFRLGIEDEVHMLALDITQREQVRKVINLYEPDEIYNLAGQSSVGQSFLDPRGTIDSIASGTLNVLEAIRISGSSTKFYNACSSECFGNTASPANEDTAFSPRSPYGAGKAASYWYVRNYRENFEQQCCSGILFNHESPLRPKNFVTSKIVSGAVDIYKGRRDFIELGNLTSVRDWGWAPEYVVAMWKMLQAEEAQDFVISTGASHSLSTFCNAVFAHLGLNAEKHIRTVDHFVRPNDILISRGDSSKAADLLGWRPRVDFDELVRKLVEAALQWEEGEKEAHGG
jgi:GDPmannose 4,6-dehydratase